jgi:hypothetical protein
MGGGEDDAVESGELKYCYVDDSIHESCGFVVLSFVFSKSDLDSQVKSVLTSCEMNPELDEYKSGVRMDMNPKMQAARDRLFKVVRGHAKVGVVIAERHHETSLGMQCLQALQSMLIRNGISVDGLNVYVDEGVFRSYSEASTELSKFKFLAKAKFFPCEKSHVRRGIQIADLVAHTLAQAVRDGLSENPRYVEVGGAESGFEDDGRFPLSDLLIAQFGYSIICRSMVRAGISFDPATDPLVVDIDSDVTSYGLYPEVLGWGVQVSQAVSDRVRIAVSKMLGRIWRGCMH